MRETVREKSNMSEVIVGEKDPDDQLLPLRFRSAHLIDTVLSHEATGDDL